MSRRGFFTTSVAMVLLIGSGLVACGDDSSTAPVTSSSTSATTQPDTTQPGTTQPDTTQPATTQPATTQPATTSSPATAPTTVGPTSSVPGELEQAAIWPAADIAFATPEQAAADFVAQVLGVPPELGEFMPGDSRSGEIEVFSPGEGGPGSRVVRSLLLLRRLGPDDGWFVLAAIAEGVTITSPSQGSTVAPGVIEVSGVGRGFEATLLVKVVPAGDPVPLTEPVIAAGGALETPEPYTATIDLTGVAAGTTLAVVVRGDTGLETDPGEFSAVAVVVG